MRLAAAIGVIAVTLAAAVYVHERHTLGPDQKQQQSIHVALRAGTITKSEGATLLRLTPLAREHPSWEDPAAVLLALGGLAVAAGILTVKRANPSLGARD